VVALNRAVAVSMVAGAEAGLAAMTGIDLPGYHYLPAARAALLVQLGRSAEAAQCYDEALGLAANAAEQRYLRRQRELLSW
jgi:predicted RNA polymerase sigma factor